MDAVHLIVTVVEHPFIFRRNEIKLSLAVQLKDHLGGVLDNFFVISLDPLQCGNL
jgi:hypothetical protein